MRVKESVFREVAALMAPRFSAIVVATGQLTDEDMKRAMADARRAGVRVPKLGSDRSLMKVNHYYMGELL